MGDPMSRRLIAAGFDVTLWNRTPEKAASVATESGAQLADDVASLIDGVDVIMLCLANTAVVQELVFGPGGLAEHGHPGNL